MCVNETLLDNTVYVSYAGFYIEALPKKRNPISSSREWQFYVEYCSFYDIKKRKVARFRIIMLIECNVARLHNQTKMGFKQ